MQENPPEVKPEVVFACDLVRDVMAGKLLVPKFQRPFVWRREQMTDLLDSIRKQYPIGSLLIWETDDHLAHSDWVGPVQVRASPQRTTSLLLDGQQRLSTLVGVLKGPQEGQEPRPDFEDEGAWQIWFNAESGDFEHPKSGAVLQPWHFPLWKLMETVEYLDECARILQSGHTEARRFVNVVQELARTFNAYKLPVIRIKDTGLSQAVEIFARLNSRGQRMSADEMVSALSYSEDQDGRPTRHLSEEIDSIVQRIEDIGFGKINRIIVLRSLLAALGEDIYRTDWTRLTEAKRGSLSSSLPDAVATTGDALERAVVFLQGLGVKTERVLPYGMQLVVLCAFFQRCQSPTPEQRAFLRRWFWVSSFTCNFASSNPSRDGYLVKEFRDEVSANLAPTTLRYMRLDEAAEPFPAAFDMRSARARVWLLVLLSLRPRSRDGIEIPEPWRDIANRGPDAIDNICVTVRDKELKSSPANRILRIEMGIRRSQAKSWLTPLSQRLEAERNAILESHGIPTRAFSLLEAGDHDAFLQQRREYLIHLEIDFMRQEGVALPRDLEPRPAPIDTE